VAIRHSGSEAQELVVAKAPGSCLVARVTLPRQYSAGRKSNGSVSCCFLVAAAAAPASDRENLPAIKAARSIIAEWALVNEIAIAARLQASYVDGMRNETRRQLGANLKSLSNPASSEDDRRRTAWQGP
jgi:hypothetical protein